MWFPDLGPCLYFTAPRFAGLRLIAVGWLEPGHPFDEGPPDESLLHALEYLFELHGHSFFCGGHLCGFCAAEAAERGNVESSFDSLPAGYRDLFITNHGGDGYYAVPELITHYIVKHGYQPPAEFREAIKCPRPLDLTR